VNIYYIHIMNPTVEANKSLAKIEQVTELYKDQSVIKIYANGFQCGLTLGDGSIVFRQDENSICLVHMSVPAMKSLANKLNEILDTYAKDLNVEIDGFEELIKKVKK